MLVGYARTSTADQVAGLEAQIAQLELTLEDLEASEARIREEEAIRGDLGRYLPREIVERVVRREQDMALGGTRRAISVLFADVVAFTPLTERLPP